MRDQTSVTSPRYRPRMQRKPRRSSVTRSRSARRLHQEEDELCRVRSAQRLSDARAKTLEVDQSLESEADYDKAQEICAP